MWARASTLVPPQAQKLRQPGTEQASKTLQRKGRAPDFLPPLALPQEGSSRLQRPGPLAWPTVCPSAGSYW